MKFIFSLALTACLSCSVFAENTPPNDASILELMSVMHVREGFDAVAENQLRKIKIATAPGFGEGQMTEGQKKIMAEAQVELTKLLRDEFSWSAYSAMYTRTVKSIYSQEEVDALVAFYRTPIGQSVQKKANVISALYGEFVDGRMRNAQPKINQFYSQTVRRYQDAVFR
jgi:hypothetical protein